MITLGELAKKTEGTVIGDPNIVVSTVSVLETAKQGDLTFCLEKKFQKQAQKSQASAMVTPFEIDGIVNQLIVKSPRLALIAVLNKFYPDYDALTLGNDPIDASANIHKSAKIAQTVSIGPNTTIESDVQIYPGVCIGANCHIGKGTTLFPNVTLYNRCHIGEASSIHAGCIIGSDGFGYVQVDGVSQKVPHIGSVFIEDNVEIGANSTVDRGCLGETRIKSGTKIDNLVQVGHNAQLGNDCVLAAQVGIAGSSIIGDQVIFGGQSGSTSVKIGSYTTVASRAGVTKDIAENQLVSGFPARPHKEELKERAAINQWIRSMKKRGTT